MFSSDFFSFVPRCSCTIFIVNELSTCLRGDFLEYRAICAQKYRHALRESEAFCCFC